MKRFVSIFIFAFLLFPMMVFAQNVEIKEVKMVEKSENAEIVANPKINELAIDFNIKLNALNDYVKYKVILNNKDDIDYIISKSGFEDNEYISYDIESDNLEKLEAKKEKVIYLTIKYEKKIPEEVFLDNKYVLSNNFSFTLDDGKEEVVTTNETTNKEEQIKNPETGIKDYGIIVGVSIGVLAIVIYCFNRNKKFFKPLVLFLSFSFLIYPVVGKAIILMKFSMETTVTIEKGVALYEISINPNGGIYEDKEEITKVKLINGKTYNVSKPKREGFIFSRWEVEGKTSSIYDKEIDRIKIVSSDILLKAIWVSESNIIAKIKETGIVYESIQAAYEAAKDKETVILMNDTTENTINTKNITFDLNGHTQNGSLTNKGDILLYGGSIKSEDIAIKNEGTLTLGFDDETVNSYECKVGEDNGCISVIGKNQGIDTQNGTFNFYDGYIKGTIGIVGGCKKTPYSGLTDDGSKLYYHATVDNDKNGYQYVYLTDSSKAVSKTITNGEVYYYNLQDNFNSSMISGYEVYAVRDFEAAYILSVNEDKKILFDVNGYNVQTGNDINNNGTLEIINSNEARGRIESSHSIINNGLLKLSKVKVEGNSNAAIVINNKDLEMVSSTIKGSTGYGVSANESTGTIKMDDTSLISSTSNAGLNISKDVTQTITNGNISSDKSNAIYNQYGVLVLDGVTSTSTSGASVYNSGGTITINSGTYTSDKSININNVSGTININDGKFSSNTSNALYNNSIVNIKNGAFRSETGTTIYNRSATLTIENCDILSNYGKALETIGGVVTINDGKFVSNNGVTFRNTYDSGIWSRFDSNVTINGGYFETFGTDSNDYAIESDSILTINGGSVISNSSYGIYQKYGTTNIGTKDGVINPKKPIIKGNTYGVYIYSGILNFYDGVLKGKTNGYYGSFTSIEDATVIERKTENIDDVDFVTNYLVTQKDFLEVDGVKYNSFEKAMSSIEETGTIKVIESVQISYGLTIPKEKDVTIDLNGKTITSTIMIENSGKLKVLDSSKDKTGKLVNTKTYVIDNKYNAELTIDGGNFKATTGYAIYNEGGIATINSINVESDTSGIGNMSGTMKIKSANITSKSTGIYAQGNITIENATINSGSNSLEIYYGSMTINGGTYKSATNSALYNYGGTLTVNGGTFTTENNTTFTNRYSSGTWSITHTNVNINGGTFKYLGTNANYYAVANYSKMNILGGNIESSSGYAVYTENYELNIGSKDGTVDKDAPIIKGSSYGVHIKSGVANFYDGTLKGKTNGYNGNFTSIEDATVIEDGTEVIDNENYKLNYLVAQKDFLEVDGVKYNSFEKAMSSIEETGTIKVIETVQVNYGLTISKEKDIILDLNGKTVTSTIMTDNSGKLKVIDSSSEKNGGLINTKTYAINNNYGAELIIDSGNIKSTNNFAVYNNGGNVTINSIKIESDASGLYNMSGTMNIKSANIKVKNVGISARGNVIIDDAEVITESTSLEIYYGNVTINNGSFNSKRGPALNNYGSTVTVNDGTFISENNYTFYNRDASGTWSTTHTNVTINGGSFTYLGTSTSYYAIYNDSKMKILGGTIESKNGYAIFTKNNDLTLGNNDNQVSTTIPIIKGDTYGLYIESGTVSFYDGVLKGKTNGYYGVINQVEKDYDVSFGTETIDTDEYQIVYLTKITEFVSNTRTGKKYLDLQLAIDETEENDTLVLSSNVNIYSDITISNVKTLKIDLSDFDIYITKKIVNEGNLEIVNTGSKGNASKIVNPNNMTVITNNGSISLEKVQLKCGPSAYSLLNNKTANIFDSILSGYGGVSNSKTGNLLASNSLFDGTYSSIYNQGSMNLADIHINSGSYGIYNESLTINDQIIIDKLAVQQKNGTSGCAVYNRGGSMKINDFETNGSINNYTNSTLEIETGTINYQLVNSGTAIINNLNLNYDETGSNYSSARNIVTNTGILNLSNFDMKIVKINYGEVRSIVNNGTLNMVDSNLNVEKNTSGNLYGIYQDNGSINYTNSNIDVSIGSTVYGVYVKNGNIGILSGSINANNKTNAYGIYIENGTVTLGEAEDSSSEVYGTENANVSITNPSIKAIGTTTGIGVKRVNGYFNFYDGIITGSTNAKPDITSTVEYKYQVENHVDPATGYEYCILEYMKE